ncbi:MAG: hypothetical protein AAGU74_12585 [Bacillota bacterium]
MWLVVYIAKGRQKADYILQQLEKEGLMARSAALHGQRGLEEYFEIMVLKSESEFAREIIMKLGI